MFTTAFHSFLPLARITQLMHLISVFVKYTLILYSLIRLGPKKHRVFRFPKQNTICTSLPRVQHSPPISIFSIWSHEWGLVSSTDHKAPPYVVFSTPLSPRTLFSYTITLRSSINARHQVSHPYKTTSNIILAYPRFNVQHQMIKWTKSDASYNQQAAGAAEQLQQRLSRLLAVTATVATAAIQPRIWLHCHIQLHSVSLSCCEFCTNPYNGSRNA
jgi:hypothetical protein